MSDKKLPFHLLIWTHIAAAIVGATSQWILTVSKLLWHPISDLCLKVLTPSQILQGLIYALIVILGLVFYSFKKRSLQLTERFRPHPNGYYTDPRTKSPTCPSCLSKGQISHIFLHNALYICPCCQYQTLPPDTQTESYGFMKLRKLPGAESQWKIYCPLCNHPIHAGSLNGENHFICTQRPTCDWKCLCGNSNIEDLSNRYGISLRL